VRVDSLLKSVIKWLLKQRRHGAVAASAPFAVANYVIVVCDFGIFSISERVDQRDQVNYMKLSK